MLGAMSFEIVPAYEVPLTEQAAISNEAFAGYVGGWTELDAGSLARFLLLQGADLFYSRFLRARGCFVGFGYINRTGNILRLAAMGIVPEARGTGAAAQLLEHLFADAKERGDSAMMLEVIEQNPRAHAVYRRHGFREVTRLLSWRCSASLHGDGDSVQEIPLLDALRLPATREYPEIPWQISQHAIAKTVRARAFRLDDACVVISDPVASPIRLHSLFSASGEWTELRGALGGVTKRFAGSEFFAPAIWPEDYGTYLFEPLGFARDLLSQFLMRLDF